MSSIADRVSIFYAGRIVESGPTRELLDDAAPSVHPRAARRAAASGGRWRHGARRDPRLARDTPCAARRLRVPPTLPARDGAVEDRGAGARPDLRRPQARLPRRPVSAVMSAASRCATSRSSTTTAAGARCGPSPGPASPSSGDRSSASSASRAAARARSRGPRSGSSQPEAGTVLLEGSRCHRCSARPRSREHARVQMVFQNPFASLNPRRTIGSQIADGLDARRHREERPRDGHGGAARRRSASGRLPRRATRTSSPAGSVSASRSHARSRPTHRSSCSTSRSRRSTPRRRRRRRTCSCGSRASAGSACC